MAINTQKFLPAPKSSALPNISQKTIKNISVIKVKVIQIENILKGTIALEKKSLDEKKRKESGTRREKQEEKLETKPNVEKGNIKMPSAPKLGILDWVKNFIGNIILGYFAVRLIDHLPKIMPIVKFLGAAADFIIDIGGKLLNGLASFIDAGYKAYDATRGFIKNLGGENFAKGFDKFTGLIDTALFLTTVLAGSMTLEAMNNRNDSRSPGGDLRGRPTPGTGGRPKVTTSSGGGAGKPDIRNPLRQKPKVTTGGGGDKFKIPSGSSIKAGGIATLVMLIPDLISSGMLISQGRPKDGIRTFLSAVAAVGAGMAAIAGVTAGAAALGITGVGLPAAIALAIAGFAASSAASFLAYEGAEALLKKMGLVDNDPKTGKPYTYKGGGITRGGKTQGKIKRTIKKPKRTIRTLPSKVKPGQSIGGEKNIKKIFPEVESKDKGKKINPYGYMKSSYEKLSSAEAFGGLFALPLKAQFGEEPSKLDYQNAASGLNSWMQRTFSSGIMRTGGVGFAEGGKVEAGMFSNSEDLTKIISKSLEESISSKVTNAINDLKKQLGLKPNEKEKKKGDEIETTIEDATISEGEMDLFQRLIVAESGGQGLIGQSLVARSVLNRAGLIQSGKASKGTFNANDGTITGVITGKSQYQPYADGSPSGTINTPRTSAQMSMAKSAIELGQNPDKLKEKLKSENIDSENIKKLLAATGFRTGSAFEDPSQNVNVVKYKDHYFNTAGNTSLIVATSQVRVGSSGGGDETGLSGKAGKIIAGAKRILGLEMGKGDGCARTTRSALVAGGLSEFTSKTTQTGDLDSDPNAGRNAPELAASFGGSDLGKVIRNKSNIKAGDIILWRGGGGYDSGAITHVGIAADDGLKNQYDHNTRSGFHYRPHWDNASGRNWFAGVRLMSEGGMIKRPSLAIIAERGKEEFLLGGRTTELFNSLGPNLLEKINTAKTKPQLADILLSATYGGAAAERQQKIDAFMNQKGMPAGKGFQGRFDMFGREYDTNTGKLKLQASNKPPSPQIASYASYEKPKQKVIVLPIPIPVPTGGGNSSGSSGGTIIAMGGGSNPFDSLYKGG